MLGQVLLHLLLVLLRQDHYRPAPLTRIRLTQLVNNGQQLVAPSCIPHMLQKLLCCVENKTVLVIHCCKTDSGNIGNQKPL